MSLYAVLLAGGSGTRLWPLSTPSMPKQFLPLHSKRTMLQETADRLVPLIPLQNTYVVTFAEYVALVREQLPELPSEHIIVEPNGYGTAAAIGLAATFIMAREPKAVMGSFPADLLFLNEEQYRQALQFAEILADQGYLVALGVEPTSAETGYGYIQVGEPLTGDKSGLTAFKVLQFRNKPDREQAEAYIRQRQYIWHTGVFIWRTDRILEEIRLHVPGVREGLDAIGYDLAQGRGNEVTADAWNGLGVNVSIEASVVEESSNVAVIPLPMGWSDLGSWTQIAALHSADECQNRVQMLASGRHIAIDTHGTFVYSKTGRTIATVGVKDLIIVETDEALLICQTSHVQFVKKVSEVLVKEPQSLREDRRDA